MPSPSAQEAYRTAMRDDLLAAAERVIERKGLTGLTIRDVLTEAGVAPGTLYSYFTGKEEILEAIAERSLAQYLTSIRPDDAASVGEAFPALVRAAFTAPIEGGTLLADLRARPSDADGAAATRRFNEDLVAGLRPFADLIEPGGGVPQDATALIELLDIVWDGMCRRASADTFVTSYERVGSVLLGLLTSADHSESFPESRTR